MSEILEKARQYEREHKALADMERPQFHATGAIGWINDPNGFSFYKGEYHLFHQYHPYSMEWGPMHWGHLKTKDFITWEWLPTAIAPDKEYDKDGCFSGSAVELPDGRQLLMYTGVEKIETESGMEEFQQQCIAIGDGLDFEKCELNPVIPKEMLPEGANFHDFRDPKIWRDEDMFYAVVANRAQDGSGAILLFESEDAIHWRFASTLATCNYEYGTMWECPDFFSLQGEHVLVISPMEMERVKYEFHPGHGVLAMIGEYDKKTHEFSKNRVQAIDYGLDFYAPQTLETPDGRRIMIAWMRNWAMTHCRKPDTHIYGAMTIPRELEIKNGRLIQNPVREFENYRINKVDYKDLLIDGELSLEGVSGRVLDMVVDVKATEDSSFTDFSVVLGKNEKYNAVISYNARTQVVEIDREHSGGRYDVIHTRKFKVSDKGNGIRMRIIMDGDSVELFVNDGEQAATFMLYSPVEADGISFVTNGKAMMQVEKYEIKREDR